MLIGFFDDTHTHQTETPITGVAGFLYREETLPALEKAWSERTHHLKKPFRAAACRDDSLKCDLARIVAAHRGAGFVSTVEDKEFDAWSRNAPSNRAWLGKPYNACLLYLLEMVRYFLKAGGLSDGVFYIIESGTNGGSEGEDFCGV
jgi:hypothetical protein